MSEDLRDKITAAIDRAEQVARAADGALSFISLDWPRTPAKDALIEHVNMWQPAAVLRRCAADRKLLSIASKIKEQAKLKQQSADRFGDPKDNDDMDATDRIAWLIQSDIAQTLAEHARQIEQALAEAWGVDA